MQLRDYQLEAIEKTASAISKYKRVCLTAATGAGKSVLIAEIARRFLTKNPSSRILILCHQSEILSQNESKMKAFGLDDVGIYCAALGRKNTRQRVILASRDSLGRNPLAAGRFEFIIIDEAHLVPIFDPEKDEPQTRYEKIFHAQNPTYLLGLTGSPYRMNGGNIFGKGKLFKEESYRISTKTLQQKGFLAPHSFPRIKELVETKRLKTKGGEFDTEEQAKAFGSDKVVIQAVREWWRLAANRKCSLFFCCSIAHSKRVEEEIKKYTTAVRHVDGELGQKERERLVSDARDGKIKAIVNCAVFTTGVDIPPIDCVVFLRATKSTALFVQMAGRGLRVSPGKNDVLYLDFAGNWERFFQINDPMILEPDPVFSQIKSGTKDESSDFLAMLGVEDQRKGVMKLCKECGEEVPAATKQCPSCGNLFISHGHKPGDGEKESFDGWRLVRPKSIVIQAHKTQKGGECAKALISLNGKTYALYLQTTGFYAARDKPLLDFLSKNPAEILMRKNPFNPSFFEAANPKYNQRSLGFLNTSTFSAGATTPKELTINEPASTDK